MTGLTTKPRVVYWNNIPSPYMVERFSALARRGNLDFEAYFNARTESDRSWEIDESTWQFRYKYVPSFRLGSLSFRFPPWLLSGKLPDLLVSLYAEPVFLVGWAIAKLRGVRTVFRTLKTFDSWVPRRWWKERLKRYVFSQVDGVETTGEDGRKYVMQYGTPSNRVFVTTHAFDFEHYKNERNVLLPQREKLRCDLGLQGVTYTYVGRLWKGKGVNYLLEAFRKLQETHSAEISLLLVGDGPEEECLRKYCGQHELRNVVFAGFQQTGELPKYYIASDVFVFPTLGDPYGLVVDEAMACALPVISTSSAGEIRKRVAHGVNGFIVPPKDSEALYTSMARFARSPELRVSMGEESGFRIVGHTPDQWAVDFEQGVSKILSLPRRCKK